MSNDKQAEQDARDRNAGVEVAIAEQTAGATEPVYPPEKSFYFHVGYQAQWDDFVRTQTAQKLLSDERERLTATVKRAGLLISAFDFGGGREMRTREDFDGYILNTDQRTEPAIQALLDLAYRAYEADYVGAGTRNHEFSIDVDAVRLSPACKPIPIPQSKVATPTPTPPEQGKNSPRTQSIISDGFSIAQQEYDQGIRTPLRARHARQSRNFWTGYSHFWNQIENQKSQQQLFDSERYKQGRNRALSEIGNGAVIPQVGPDALGQDNGYLVAGYVQQWDAFLAALETSHNFVLDVRYGQWYAHHLYESGYESDPFQTDPSQTDPAPHPFADNPASLDGYRAAWKLEENVIDEILDAAQALLIELNLRGRYPDAGLEDLADTSLNERIRDEILKIIKEEIKLDRDFFIDNAQYRPVEKKFVIDPSVVEEYVAQCMQAAIDNAGPRISESEAINTRVLELETLARDRIANAPTDDEPFVFSTGLGTTLPTP